MTAPARFDLIESLADGSESVSCGIDLGEFYSANDCDPEEVNAIGALPVGGEYVMGGGAAPISVLRRVA